ncbi:hypothetical protein ACJX0J_032049 [Zea mays]
MRREPAKMLQTIKNKKSEIVLQKITHFQILIPFLTKSLWDMKNKVFMRSATKHDRIQQILQHIDYLKDLYICSPDFTHVLENRYLIELLNSFFLDFGDRYKEKKTPLKNLVWRYKSLLSLKIERKTSLIGYIEMGYRGALLLLGFQYILTRDLLYILQIILVLFFIVFYMKSFTFLSGR